ncbi:MAG: SCO1664 family protein [Actinobacteria bacterium]|nr:SCO1664 family protein [Actinomycetota bacterium]
MHQDQRAQAPLSSSDLLRFLRTGEITIKGRMPWSSNATFLVELTAAGGELTQGGSTDGESVGLERMHGVYKPGRGERPLWDFPDGLYRREVAAWELSNMLGWGLVPETVMRNGPHGEGSVQRFIDADFEQHYFTLYEDPAHHEALRTMCVFDLLINNTDRKSGHCLLGRDQHIYGIDNGLCFHPDPKIRTVIWEFGGEPIPAGLLGDIERCLEGLPGPLDPYLTHDEIDGIRRRGTYLLERAGFPEADPHGRCYPWPLV